MRRVSIGNRNFFMAVSAKTDVAARGGIFDDIFDCTSEGFTAHPHITKRLHTPPSGKNDHNWTVEDLDTITELAGDALDKGRKVLIHCGRGVSRSTCAAAAVLLYMGKVRTVDEAIALARDEKREPVKTARASLEAWWRSKQQGNLFRMWVPERTA